MTDNGLAGIGVLVTRPAHQATELAGAVTAQGGTAIRFPVLEIVACEADAIATEKKELQPPDITVFVSPNAVRHGWRHAAAGRIAAIGPATTAAIEAAGGGVDIAPQTGFDSEHLLATDAMQNLAGKVVRIVRGNSGRELIADTLRDRGAIVEYLPVYERRLPVYSARKIAALEQQWRSGEVNVVTIMSVDSLRNLVALVPGTCRTLMEITPLVTPAARVIKEALTSFPGIPTTLARGPSASDMVDAIIACTKT